MAKKVTVEKRNSITIRFAGDSGDGMQLTGEQFTNTTALMGTDIATFPDYPAEIRAPIGTLPGVSSFQIQFSDKMIFTAGDVADVLVAMNAAALKVNLNNVKKGGLIVVNEEAFTEQNLKKATWASNPLEDGTLKDFQLLKVQLSSLTRNALKDLGLRPSETDRCKNFFALGMMFWIYDRKMDYTLKWIGQKFAKKPIFVEANTLALKAGYNYADITETLTSRFEVSSAPIAPGVYRKIMGNEACAIGLISACRLAKKTLMYGSYPITPASDILHYLAKYKHYDVKTFQAEDEIAACGFAVGASFAGAIGITGTSGPGIFLKSEMIGLAIVSELPLVIVNVQRSGPSTGMPTKTEQSDLLQAMYGRNGESPLCILAPKTPSDCFQMALEAVRIAIEYMIPVIILSDGNIANGSEPWKLPDMDSLPKITVNHPKGTSNGHGRFLPYERDEKTMARPWAKPGTKGLEHRIGGLAKANITGDVSYDPENNALMHQIRAQKVELIANSIPDLEVRGPKKGKLLILGWGSPFGTIFEATYQLEQEGVHVAHAHLNYLNPFPKNTHKVLQNYDQVLIPELNLGQLIMLVRNRFPDIKVIPMQKIQGFPFKVTDMKAKIREILDNG